MRNNLITRCPDCQTSYRITLETLRRADGKVRCGRCAAVFSAFNSLADGRTNRLLGLNSVTHESRATPRSEATGAVRGAERQDPPPTPDTPPPAPEHAVEPMGDEQLSEDEDAAHAEPISDQEVDEVLATTNAAETPPPWTGAANTPSPAMRRLWTVAACFAMLTLAAQLAHHFRAQLLELPRVGPLVASLYARLGMPAQIPSDPTDFEIVNSSTLAHSDSRDTATLEFTASIRNRSTRPRPLPVLSLKLTDRYDNAIGVRYFEPAEYLPTTARTGMLRPGSLAEARLVLVDPGPQAAGFEADLCVRLDATGLRCKGDIVFE